MWQGVGGGHKAIKVSGCNWGKKIAVADILVQLCSYRVSEQHPVSVAGLSSVALLYQRLSNMQCFGHSSAESRMVLSPRRCDADPSALANYVVALVKKDKPEKELKAFCADQLDVFLQKGTVFYTSLSFVSWFSFHCV